MVSSLGQSSGEFHAGIKFLEVIRRIITWWMDFLLWIHLSLEKFTDRFPECLEAVRPFCRFVILLPPPWVGAGTGATVFESSRRCSGWLKEAKVFGKLDMDDGCKFFLKNFTKGVSSLGVCPLPKLLGSGSVRVNLFYFFLVKGILILWTFGIHCKNQWFSSKV